MKRGSDEVRSKVRGLQGLKHISIRIVMPRLKLRHTRKEKFRSFNAGGCGTQMPKGWFAVRWCNPTRRFLMMTRYTFSL